MARCWLTAYSEQRDPDVLILRKPEARRHDANHSMDARVDLHGAADDRRIAVVAPLPQVVGEQDDGFGAGAVVVRREAATERDGHAERRKQVVADRRARVAIRIAAVADSEVAVLKGGNGTERPRPLLPVMQLEPGQRASTDSVRLLVDEEQDEALGLLVGQGLDEDAVGDAEHHGVEADADRQADDGQPRHRLAFQRGTKPEPNVLDEHEEVRRREHRGCSGVDERLARGARSPSDKITPVRTASAAAFQLTIAIGAFLLFLVEPMAARFLLPWFGGSPSVWSTCLLFFQAALLAGYVYAHLTRRLGPGRQARLHLVLLATALLTLPIIPSPAWKPTDPSHPAGKILLLLAATVGLPYVLLAATAPMVQDWFARLAVHDEIQAKPRHAVYWLYALSNLGSLLGLLAYPTSIERLLSIRGQAWFWSGGFVLFAWCASGRRCRCGGCRPPP